jgi:hypothetical protein
MHDAIAHERSGSGADLALYLDAFDPPQLVSPESLRMVGIEIIPPLLGALSDRGISAFVSHDLNYVLSVSKNSRGRMLLVPVNNPQFHPKAKRDDTNVLVLARDEQLVGCIASRLIWCEGTLAEEMESGRFWVSDPATMWRPQDRCVTKFHAARTIGACPVVYCGSVYLDPSVRGGATVAAMCRLHLLWLLCHWRWSWLVGVMESGLVPHAFNIYGVDFIEQGLWITREDDNQMHHYQLALNRRESAMEAWLLPEMGDLSRPMGRPPKAILPQEAPEQIRRSKHDLSSATA